MKRIDFKLMYAIQDENDPTVWHTYNYDDTSTDWVKLAEEAMIDQQERGGKYVYKK